jgi:hypothetical protein
MAMFLSRWFRPTKRRKAGTYRPAFCQLEDRTLPSGFGLASLISSLHLGGFPRLGGPGNTSGPATHLEVIVPPNVQSGQAFQVEVEALDASNHVASSYTGTVQLSLGTADTGATLPANYAFSAKDHGVHQFTVTLAATGSQTINAGDTATGSTITGSAATTVNPAPVATQLFVIAPEQAIVGTATNITVVALDASGHRVKNYAGTVTVSAPDMTQLPAYTFVAADQGQHTFQVTFTKAASPETVTAAGVTTSGTTTTTIGGTASLQVAAVGQVTHFGIFSFGPVVAGTPVQVEIVALDASNQVVTGYTGTVHFGSSDSGATLPSDYQFLATDNGMHLFTVTFAATGNQTLTVADAADSTTSSSHSFGVRSSTHGHGNGRFELGAFGF